MKIINCNNNNILCVCKHRSKLELAKIQKVASKHDTPAKKRFESFMIVYGVATCPIRWLSKTHEVF